MDSKALPDRRQLCRNGGMTASRLRRNTSCESTGNEGPVFRHEFGGAAGLDVFRRALNMSLVNR
jgi:hypothetical protein